MKGQVTVFIIIGIAIVIAFSLVLSSQHSEQADMIKGGSDVNLKAISPVKIYVEQTMQDLALEGIFLIGKQGGRIYKSTWPDCREEDDTYTASHRMCNQSGIFDYRYPQYLDDSPYSYKRVSIGINHSRVDDSKRITYASDEPLEQPFAYPHIGKRRGFNYIYGVQQPLSPIAKEAGNGSLEMQLSHWIKVHLPELLDFSEFEKRGYDVEIEGEPGVDVEINEELMTVKMNYTLMIDKDRMMYRVDEFYVQIDSSFRAAYDFINMAIQEDMSTLAMLIRQRMFVDGEQVGGFEVLESDPKNFEYDVAKFTIWDIDYRKAYNYPEQFYTFYFIRENRPPDASTVYSVPEFWFAGDTATWYCFNMKNGEQPFDPDEDDYYTQQPYPWSSPQWYHYYSRGDHIDDLTTSHPVDNCGVGGPILVFEIVSANLKRHDDPYSEIEGVDFLEDLKRCGNNDDDIPTTASLADVGDVIILKVQDEQQFPPGGRIEAPSRYPDDPILEDGTGRLNDALSYRPVKCTPGVLGSEPDCCGPDGYWLFDQRPLNPDNHVKENICLSTCEHKSCSLSTPSTCDCDFVKCNPEVDIYLHCDHEGKLIWSEDIKETKVQYACPSRGDMCGGC
jgi:hypothetical protein